MNPDDNFEYIVSRVSDALGDQAGLHIELIKAEIARDAKALRDDLMPLAVAIPVLGIGYVFVCVAAAAGLALLLGNIGGVLLVGVLNLIAGAALVHNALFRLRRARADAAVSTPAKFAKGTLFEGNLGGVDVLHVR